MAAWQVFERLTGPIDLRERIDAAAALIAERITNCLTETKGEPPEAADFMPRWDTQRIEWEQGGGDDGDDS
ncbi:phage tail assembly protein T [Streptosporangium becharense]|uniref:phage tail assembly protein T n=1 Tax=Streptosporangium becharense TaxID=1816182 RepID=UPI00406C7CEA